MHYTFYSKPRTFLLFLLALAFLPVSDVHAQDITSGLVGHWKFDEISGTTAADSSGNNNTGTLTNGPTWATGKINNALSFDGTDDYINLGNMNVSGSGITIAAWVKADTFSSSIDTRFISKANSTNEQSHYWMLGQTNSGGDKLRFRLKAGGSTQTLIASSGNLPLNIWFHAIATYDGSTMRLYKDGIEVGSVAKSGTIDINATVPANIGRNPDGSNHIDGAIDEARIYNRALSASDIQALYAYTGGPPDTQVPTTPTNLTATAQSSSQINLSWSASTDNIGVTGYRVERCQGAGCATFTQIATPTSNSYSDTGLSASTSYTYRVRAVDAAGNLSGYSTNASAITQAPPPLDTQAPTVPTNLSASAISSSQINLAWTASTDNVGVTGYRVERCTGSTCTTFTQISTPTTSAYNDTGNSYNDTGLSANTTYRYQVRATDAANNLSSYSSIASATTQTQTSGTTILLDDFEGSDIRMTNPSALDSKEKYLWSQYDGDGGPGTATLSTDTVKSGSKSIKDTITSGDHYLQFRPTIGSSTKNLRDFVIPPSAWQYDTFNRMRIWVKVPPGFTKWTGGQSNTQIGTYVRNTAFDGVGNYEQGGFHFYHLFNISYTGEWHQLIIDTHPNTWRGNPGGKEIGNQEYPTGESGKNYFDTLTRFYHHLYYGGEISYPSNVYYDKIELYRETNPENIDQIYSLNGIYVPATNNVIVGWQRLKDENSVKHEVRYAFSDIFQMGWNTATPAPNGTVTPPGWQGYNGMDWSTTQIDVSGKNSIYIAIKPQNSNLFRQIEIPLAGGEVTPPPTLVGDLNGDRTVNGADWTIMASVWFTADAVADINKDGIVNSIDFSLMNANWGRTI